MSLDIAILNEKRRACVMAMEEANTSGDNAKFDTANTELQSVEAQLRNKMIEDAKAGPQPNTFRGELRNYSVASLIRQAANGRIEGLEAEVSDELSRGRELRQGAVCVPTELLLGNREHRDGQMVQNNPYGGWLVPTQMGPYADRFRSRLMVEAMGATIVPGLTSNLDLPGMAQSGAVSWINNESQNATRTAASFNQISMGPRTVSGEYRMSRRLMQQTAGSIEQILRNDLGNLLATAVDAAAINGDGVIAPLGILQTPGVTKVTTEALFSDTTANLLGQIEGADAFGPTGFLTNSTVMKVCRKTVDDDNHVIPLTELFHNQRVETSNNVPANIGAGSNKSALLYAAWQHLFIGYWSSVQIVINPYHPDVASNGGALLHAFLDVDAAVRHPSAFAYAEI